MDVNDMINRLQSKKWSNTEKAINDSPAPKIEQESVTNSDDHSQKGYGSSAYINQYQNRNRLDDPVFLKVKGIIIEKLGVEASEVTMEASFTNDLGADSLDAVELIMEFEKAFGITIPDDQAETITTVGNAVRYLKSHS